MIVYLLKRNEPYRKQNINVKINAKGIAKEENILSHPGQRYLFRMIVFGCYMESLKNPPAVNFKFQ